MDTITITVTVDASLAKVWSYWNESEHIAHWAFATEDWGAESIENDLQKGGYFKTRMFARDGSASFDFEGQYTSVEPQHVIRYTMSDGREVSVVFETVSEGVRITQTFDPETEHTPEEQRSGWQGFLDNFKLYIEKP